MFCLKVEFFCYRFMILVIDYTGTIITESDFTKIKRLVNVSTFNTCCVVRCY